MRTSEMIIKKKILKKNTKRADAPELGCSMLLHARVCFSACTIFTGQKIQSHFYAQGNKQLPAPHRSREALNVQCACWSLLAASGGSLPTPSLQAQGWVRPPLCRHSPLDLPCQQGPGFLTILAPPGGDVCMPSPL